MRAVKRWGWVQERKRGFFMLRGTGVTTGVDCVIGRGMLQKVNRIRCMLLAAGYG